MTMDDENLVKALRRCSYTTVAGADREDGYCKPCAYFTEDSADVTCIDRMMIDAADAIEQLQAENDELRARWNAATIEGFPIEDLILFAMTCRANGVREKDLQVFTHNMEKAVEIVRKEFDDSIQESMNRVFQYGVEMNDACRKRNREEKPDDPIRPN